MMPKMTGPQLNNELRRRGVELPVIYTSGYAASALLPPDSDRVRFVAKPFSGHEVAAALAAHPGDDVMGGHSRRLVVEQYRPSSLAVGHAQGPSWVLTSPQRKATS